MANRKYEEQDLEDLVKGLTDINKLCEKYGTKPHSIIRQANRRGYYSRKTKVIIVSPFKNIVCDSITDCAYELGVSIPTIYKALKGERVKIFEELDITIKKGN